MKLISAVLYEDKQHVEVIVDDDEGKRRRIEIVWKSGNPSPVLESWVDNVKAEIELQRAADLERRTGRQLL